MVAGSHEVLAQVFPSKLLSPKLGNQNPLKPQSPETLTLKRPSVKFIMRGGDCLDVDGMHALHGSIAFKC